MKLRRIGLFSALAASKALLIALVAFVSLAFSIASFSIPALATLIQSGTAWITGKSAVVMASEVAELRRNKKAIENNNRKLGRRNDALAKRNERLKSRSLRLTTARRNISRRNEALTEMNERLKPRSLRLTTSRRNLSIGHRALLEQNSRTHDAAIASTARRIGRRSVRSTARSIAAIPLESTPVIGAGIIIMVTAWELRDSCATVKDMDQIQRNVGLVPVGGFVEKICGALPLRAIRARHYGNMTISECEASAEEARDNVYLVAKKTLEDSKSLKTVEINEETRKQATNEFEEIMEICRCLEDLDCDPMDMG